MSKAIRISEDVEAALLARAEPDENPNDVLRRLVGLPPKTDRRRSRNSSRWSQTRPREVETVEHRDGKTHLHITGTPMTFCGLRPGPTSSKAIAETDCGICRQSNAYIGATTPATS